MSLTDKPHGQWKALAALTHLPPFGQTAKAVAKVSLQSESGARTRLKELEDMGIVTSHDAKPRRIYFATPIAYRILQAGKDGQMALRIMRSSHAALETQRAAELAPIKDKWDHIIRNQMQMIALGALGSLGS